MPINPSELYLKHKAEVFQLLSVLVQDPKAIKEIVEQSKNTSFLGKLKTAKKGAGFWFKNKKDLSVINNRKYYKAQAREFWQILKGERENDLNNFLVKLLQDPETQSFLKDNQAGLDRLLDELVPSVLPIVLEYKPVKLVMKGLRRYGVTEEYIRRRIQPVFLEYIKTRLQEPEKIFSLLKPAIGLFISPPTVLSHNTFEFLRKSAHTLQSFLKEPGEDVPNKAIVSLGMSFFAMPSKKDSEKVVQKWDENLINHLCDIAERSELTTFAKALPEYLKANKTDIVNRVTSNLEMLKEILPIPQDFSESFVKNTLETGIDLSEELAPFLITLTQKVFSEDNKTMLGILMTHIRALQKIEKAPPSESPSEPKVGIKLPKIDYKENAKQYDLRLKAIITCVFALETDNHVLKHLPGILSKYANPLGDVINQFLTQTQKGREFVLYIQTHKILELTSRHMPQIKVISDAYRKGEPWFWKACQLLKDKEILKLAFETLVNYIGYKYRKKLQTGLVRRLHIGEPMKAILQSYKVGGNLGDFLKDQASGKKNTLKYSLMTRDLSGLKISADLSGSVIEDFKFDKAIFTKTSFANSYIVNCSFKNVKFKDKPNFQGTTMDEDSYTSLMPAISEYNKNHPTDLIIPPQLAEINFVDKMLPRPGAPKNK